jgi:hypothetical protein
LKRKDAKTQSFFALKSSRLCVFAFKKILICILKTTSCGFV